jgi:hypothetical protein
MKKKSGKKKATAVPPPKKKKQVKTVQLPVQQQTVRPAPVAVQLNPNTVTNIKQQSAMSNFTNVQFIGYEIDTAPKDASFLNGRLYAGTYLGLPDIGQDISQRCQLMYDAVVTASRSPRISTDPATLKIFMAPEFFFRGPQGAYTMEEVQTVINELQTRFTGIEWQGWMFVFGTIVGYSDISEKDFKTLLSQTYNKPVSAFLTTYNVVLVQGGGYTDVADAEALARIIMKENVSGIDFMIYPTSGIDWRTVTALPPLSPPGVGSEMQIVNYDGLCQFQLFNLTFGLEVCLDHLKGRLSASPVSPDAPLVQIQLVPSCGASLQADAIVAQNDGFAFNVDGITPPSSTARAVNKVLPLASVTEAVDPTHFSPPVLVDHLYASGPGQVAVYTPVALPGQQYATGYMFTSRVSGNGILYDFVLWYKPDKTFDRVYCTTYFEDNLVMIESICLPIANGQIGNRVSMYAEVRDVKKDPVTGHDRGVWMELYLGTYSVQGIVVTFLSKLP